jgi:hypothetical protein
MRPFPKQLLSKEENTLLQSLTTPSRIQDYLNTLQSNNKDTVQSVRETIKKKQGHCLEGALVAAAALWYHGEPPLLFDLQTTKDDKDHVLALFKRDGYFGAISRTSHSVLRYRDPIYKTLRELALSYFHEYFLDAGEKTLRGFSSTPFHLSTTDTEWLVEGNELYEVGAELDDSKHTPLFPPQFTKRLRKADKLERKAASLKD